MAKWKDTQSLRSFIIDYFTRSLQLWFEPFYAESNDIFRHFLCQLLKIYAGIKWIVWNKKHKNKNTTKFCFPYRTFVQAFTKASYHQSLCPVCMIPTSWIKIEEHLSASCMHVVSIWIDKEDQLMRDTCKSVIITYFLIETPIKIIHPVRLMNFFL